MFEFFNMAFLFIYLLYINENISKSFNYYIVIYNFILNLFLILIIHLIILI